MNKIKKIWIAASIAVSINFVLIVCLQAEEQLDLRSLYEVYLKGSGYDDGVSAEIQANSGRYAREVIELLKISTAGSRDEEVALFGAEFVLSKPGITEALVDYGTTHPNKDTKCFIESILDGPPQTIPVARSSNGKVTAVLLVSDDSCDRERR